MENIVDPLREYEKVESFFNGLYHSDNSSIDNLLQISPYVLQATPSFRQALRYYANIVKTSFQFRKGHIVLLSQSAGIDPATGLVPHLIHSSGHIFPTKTGGETQPTATNIERYFDLCHIPKPKFLRDHPGADLHLTGRIPLLFYDYNGRLLLKECENLNSSVKEAHAFLSDPNYSSRKQINYLGDVWCQKSEINSLALTGKTRLNNLLNRINKSERRIIPVFVVPFVDNSDPDYVRDRIKTHIKVRQ